MSMTDEQILKTLDEMDAGLKRIEALGKSLDEMDAGLKRIEALGKSEHAHRQECLVGVCKMLDSTRNAAIGLRGFCGHLWTIEEGENFLGRLDVMVTEIEGAQEILRLLGGIKKGDKE